MGHKYFYLTRRKDKGGVYYARFVLDKPFGGTQVLPWVSTRETDERKAAEWAALHGPAPKSKIPLGDTMPFSAFAEGWWQPGHEYVKRQVARGFSLGGSYLAQCRSLLSNHLIPHFGRAVLASISPRHVDDFLFTLAGKGLSSSTVNHCLSVLSLMLTEAKFRGLIKDNPTDGVRRMANRPHARGILTLDEVKRLLDETTINTVWDGNLVHYCINLLAASTGMRAGEIMALRVGHVHLPPDGYVEVVSAWKRSDQVFGDPKCRSFREIPLPEKTAKYVALVMNQRAGPDELLFPADAERYARRQRSLGKSATACTSPIGHHAIQAHLYDALSKLTPPIDPVDRRVVFHSWRHWFTSLIRNSNSLPDHVARRLTGHRSSAIEGYTHTDRSDLTPVLKIVGGSI